MIFETAEEVTYFVNNNVVKAKFLSFHKQNGVLLAYCKLPKVESIRFDVRLLNNRRIKYDACCAPLSECVLKHIQYVEIINVRIMYEQFRKHENRLVFGFDSTITTDSLYLAIKLGETRDIELVDRQDMGEKFITEDTKRFRKYLIQEYDESEPFIFQKLAIRGSIRTIVDHISLLIKLASFIELEVNNLPDDMCKIIKAEKFTCINRKHISPLLENKNIKSLSIILESIIDFDIEKFNNNTTIVNFTDLHEDTTLDNNELAITLAKINGIIKRNKLIQNTIDLI
jgi:hypothetical protein